MNMLKNLFKKKIPVSNQIMVIHPYLWEGTWVFDDADTGLKKEALVAGIPEIIAQATSDAGIKNPEKGFTIIFSKDFFPGHQVRLDLSETQEDECGTWYEWKEKKLKGWLCPALFKYFPEAPKSIYCQVKEK